MLGRGVNTMVDEVVNMLMLSMLYGNRFEVILWSDEVERMVVRPQGAFVVYAIWGKKTTKQRSNQSVIAVQLRTGKNC